MNNQRKVKFIISLAILIIVALFVVVVFQIVNITKVRNQISRQQEQIEQLEKDLDYYKNKTPNSNYESIN